jgi:hypothetical protein
VAAVGAEAVAAGAAVAGAVNIFPFIFARGLQANLLIDAYILENESLLVGKLRGTLDLRLATKLVELIEFKEEELERGFNRVCDLTHLKGVRLSEKDVQALAVRRLIHNPNNVRVKSAFIATDPLAKGIASMYQALLASDRINVKVFDTHEAAAAWLQVPPGKLKL